MRQCLDLLIFVSASILFTEDCQCASNSIWCYLVEKQLKIDVCQEKPASSQWLLLLALSAEDLHSIGSF